MFKTQVEQLKETQEKIEGIIESTEYDLKKQKEELRDVKQAIASLERIQAKYENKMEVEVAL